MKKIRIGFYILLFVLIAPFPLLSQNKEIPVTTSSNEAFNFFMKGRDKLENFETTSAAALFDQAIQADPNFATAYLYRAQSGGGYTVYRQNLDKAVSLTDNVSEGEKYRIWYSQALADGNGAKQKEYLGLLLKNFPSDKRVQLDAGIYYYSINDFSEALKHFSRSTELDKTFAPAFNMVGYAQAALKNYKEAEEAFLAYIKLGPDSPNGYDSYAELLLRMGRYPESISQYEKALELDPGFSFSLTGIGNNYIFMGDYPNARKYYQEFFEKSTSPGTKRAAVYWKAVSFVHEGKIEDAIKTLDEYRAMAEKANQVTDVILSYANQGFILAETGNPTEATKYYDKAIDLIMNSKLPETVRENFMTDALLWHFYTLTANNELDKAKLEAEKAKQKVTSRKNPGEEMFLNSLFGLYEIKKGNPEKSIQYYSKADAEDPLNWYYSAMAYNQKGDKQNAKKLFEKVTQSNVNSLNLALVRNRAIDALKK